MRKKEERPTPARTLPRLKHLLLIQGQIKRIDYVFGSDAVLTPNFLENFRRIFNDFNISVNIFLLRFFPEKMVIVSELLF